MRFKTEAVGGYDFSGLILYALLILGALIACILLCVSAIVKAMKNHTMSPMLGRLLLVLLLLGPVVAIALVFR